MIQSLGRFYDCVNKLILLKGHSLEKIENKDYKKHFSPLVGIVFGISKIALGFRKTLPPPRFCCC